MVKHIYAPVIDNDIAKIIVTGQSEGILIQVGHGARGTELLFLSGRCCIVGIQHVGVFRQYFSKQPVGDMVTQ